MGIAILFNDMELNPKTGSGYKYGMRGCKHGRISFIFVYVYVMETSTTFLGRIWLGDLIKLYIKLESNSDGAIWRGSLYNRSLIRVHNFWHIFKPSSGEP